MCGVVWACVWGGVLGVMPGVGSCTLWGLHLDKSILHNYTYTIQQCRTAFMVNHWFIQRVEIYLMKQFQSLLCSTSAITCYTCITVYVMKCCVYVINRNWATYIYHIMWHVMWCVLCRQEEAVERYPTLWGEWMGTNTVFRVAVEHVILWWLLEQPLFGSMPLFLCIKLALLN